MYQTCIKYSKWCYEWCSIFVKVIEYDRFQPEFYEDTKTYIKKRTSDKKVKNALKIYKQNKVLIDEVEKKFKKKWGESEEDNNEEVAKDKWTFDLMTKIANSIRKLI